jgi:hypothetical protein
MADGDTGPAAFPYLWLVRVPLAATATAAVLLLSFFGGGKAGPLFGIALFSLLVVFLLLQVFALPLAVRACMRARAWPARALLAMGCGVLQIAFVAWFAIRVVFSDLT